MSLFKHLNLIAVTGALLAGCAPEPGAQVSTALAPEGFDLPVDERVDGIRPAWETEAERLQSKAEGFDVRGRYQDIFGFTAAPSRAPRALSEFEAQEAVVLAWEGDLSPFFADLVDAIEGAATVYIITPSVDYSEAVKGYLEDAGTPTARVRFFEFEHESFWTRDFGPIPIALEGGQPAFVDPQYYPNRRRDDAVPTLMSRSFDVPVYRPELATEGGNFMTNGEGLCVATEWLLEENPGLSGAEVARIKRDYYGCEETVILERMDGEGTGHVDMFAKFTARDTVLVGQYEPWQDARNAAILDRNAERLANTRLPDGSTLRVVRIPMPAANYPVYRSYTNSLIINDTVVVPVYRRDRAFESEALAAYRRALPGNYRVVTVEAEDVIQMGGAVHCVTMGFALDEVEAPTPQPSPAPQPEPQPEPAEPEAYTDYPDAPITDGQRTEAVISVGTSGEVDQVVVQVEIAHTYVGDLRVELSHAGKSVELWSFSGGSADDLRRTFVVDDFAGSPRAGDWTLAVEDAYRGDVGTLEAWGIRLD